MAERYGQEESRRTPRWGKKWPSDILSTATTTKKGEAFHIFLGTKYVQIMVLDAYTAHRVTGNCKDQEQRWLNGDAALRVARSKTSVSSANRSVRL